MKSKKRLALFAAVLIFLAASLPAQETGDLSLTLEDAILKALKNNLNVAAEVYGPELAGASLSQAKEKYLPRLDFSFGRQSTKEPSYWWIQGAETVFSKYNDYNLTVAQQIPMGGSLSLSMDSYRSDTNQAFQLINPRYGSTLRFDFTQPLLRNFGPTASRREILVARHNLEISESQLRSVLVDTVYQVQESYWNLVYAIEYLRVKRQSLQLARDLLTKNRKEVEVGQLAPIEALNSEAVVAQREADILQAEAQVRRSEDVLRTVVNLAAEGEIRGRRIVPAEKPAFEPRQISLEEAVEEALLRRPDLQAAKSTIAGKQVDFSVARNQLLPSLDFKLSYWSPGVSGDRLIYSGDDIFSGIVIGRVKGSATDSLRDAMKLLYNNWSVGLTLSLPIADLVSRANYAIARVGLEQSQARLKTQEQQVYLEVSDAVLSIETDAKRVQAYRIARELAEKRLEAETKKLAVGLTTNYFVLQYQEELANARSMEIKALIDYNLSLARYEKVTGRSLESRHIALSGDSK